jgi:glutamate mutase epsilon subunit
VTAPCISRGPFELIASVIVFAIVANAIGIMPCMLKFGEAVRNIAVALGRRNFGCITRSATASLEETQFPIKRSVS